ncbi:MAG: AFG1/ZapE family ATPase, partial [Pseudomonadota bacterium]
MSLTDIYHSQISAGTLTADPAQAAVIPMFEQIAVALNTPVKRRWFQKNHPPNPGLYLWGGVGRGKS